MTTSTVTNRSSDLTKKVALSVLAGEQRQARRRRGRRTRRRTRTRRNRKEEKRKVEEGEGRGGGGGFGGGRRRRRGRGRRRRRRRRRRRTVCLFICLFVCLFVGCLTSQQLASVSQGRICSDNFTCCHTKIEVADQTFHLTQSQYTDTGTTSPSADPIMPDAWQGSHWSANFYVTGMTRPGKITSKEGF